MLGSIKDLMNVINHKNQKLGLSLEVAQRISVNQVTTPQIVDVMIDVLYPSGRIGQLPAQQVRSLKAIGMSLRTYND